MGWLRALTHSTDPAADSINVAALGALVVLSACAIWAVVADPHSFNPLGLGSGLGTILGGFGVGRRLRDGLVKE